MRLEKESPAESREDDDESLDPNPVLLAVADTVGDRESYPICDVARDDGIGIVVDGPCIFRFEFLCAFC